MARAKKSSALKASSGRRRSGEPLSRYRAMRDFAKTPEPAGGATRPSGPRGSFVVQKHDATRLHYDFRLEMEGVLRSWAVPKGPSLDPADKRLAMQTEDHPLEYGDFEGVIPEKQYGAGPVIVWDRGTWEPEGDPVDAWRRGAMHFTLHGEKLKGSWRLVRMRDDRAWLLIKSRDEAARTGPAADLPSRLPRSVTSGRTIEEVLDEPDALWHSNRPVASAREVLRPASRSRRRPSPTRRGTRKTARPASDPPGGREAAADGVHLTNPDRVLWPSTGLTKRGLVEYYAAIADWALPEIGGRPLSLVRCPRGATSHCFYQKHAPAGLQGGVGRVRVRESSGPDTYMYVETLEGIFSLVQMGVLEFHTWGARADDPETPDRIVMDIDPAPDVPFARVVEAAKELRERLLSLGLVPFVKTTGGKGLHVVAPLRRRHGWDLVKEFTRVLALQMVADAPDRYLAKAAKDARKGKIFVDWLRNAHGATAVASFSTRAKEIPTVSTPLSWKEVTPRLDPTDFRVDTVPKRLARLRADPWADYDRSARDVATAVRALEKASRA